MSLYNSINWKRINPLNKNIVVALEQEEEVVGEGGVVITQLYKPKNHFRILRMPDDIDFSVVINNNRHRLGINDKILVTRLNDTIAQRHLLCGKEKTYIIPLSMVMAVWIERLGRLIPIGPNLLLKRITHTELDLDTKLIRPAFTFDKDQSLDCEVLELGMLEGGAIWNTPIKIGDLVQLKGWSMDHIEVSVAGQYCLIAAEKDLSHIETREMTLEFA